MKSILIRADGSKDIGLGHLTRQIDIADELRDLNFEIYFLSKHYLEGISLIEHRNFDVIKLSPEEKTIQESIEEIEKVLVSLNRKFDIILIDLVKNFNNQQYLNNIKNFCKKLFILSDDPAKFCVNVDAVFAISPNQEFFTYKGLETKYYTGLRYFPLHRKFQNVRKKKIKKAVSNILLTFGGSDPNNYSMKIVEILRKINLNPQIILILGAAFPESEYEKLRQKKFKNLKIKKDVSNMISYFRDADIAICSAGNTLIEALTCGVPCIVIPQTNLENERAAALEKQNMIINIGSGFDEFSLIDALNDMWSFSKRRKFSEKSQEKLDGKGIKRIVKILTEENTFGTSYN
ncbi:MAG: hypothetical protein EU539_01085 [Promethearchaeota archaeon]|nr:MAG: hypothetical protein EU539_01085 [Candidatus Lokiarchaeota archaeon]